MAPRGLAKEIAYPLTDMTVLVAMVAFALLSALAQAAGILGLWLAVLLVPASFRYLLALLEARANGRAAPVATIEMFNIADNFWTLAPLVIFAVAIWGGFLLAQQGFTAAARLAGLAVFVVLPASLAILAITRSPFESLNPAAWIRMARACSADYVIAAVVPPLTAVLLSMLPLDGMPAGVYAYVRQHGDQRVLHPGDIGCVAKLRNTHTNDTLSTREHPVRLPQIALPEPIVTMAVHATVRGEEEDLVRALELGADDYLTKPVSFREL